MILLAFSEDFCAFHVCYVFKAGFYEGTFKYCQRKILTRQQHLNLKKNEHSFLKRKMRDVATSAL